MRCFLLLTMLTLVMHTAFADIYRWIDDQGNVHFSDQPHEGGEKINLPPPQQYTPAPMPSVEVQKAQPTPSHSESLYKTFSIAEPVKNATIRNNTGTLDVTILLLPGLEKGHLIRVLLDGQAAGDFSDTAFTLNQVYRGQHTLQVQIVNEQGNVINETEPVVFYKQRNTIRIQ